MENIQLVSASKTIRRPKRAARYEASGGGGRPPSDPSTSREDRARKHAHVSFGGSPLPGDHPTMPEPTALFPPAITPKKAKLRVHCETDPTTRTVVAKVTEPPEGLREFGGSSDWPEFNGALVRATIATVPTTDPANLDRRITAALAGLAAFKPIDEVEGMIAGQAVALHQAAMTCLARAMIPGQDFDAACRLRKDGANMSRAMTDMLDALDRKRGKGPQVVRVERVVVHEGGQAIVGTVAAAAAGVHSRGEGGSGV
jgi:hypothetical protein